MKPFEYASPTSLNDAVGLLSDNWGRAELMAGGTDLVTCLKQGLVEPARVVSLRNIASLKGIRADGNRWRIGAMTSLADLTKHEGFAAAFPSLAQAAAYVASPQLMNAGTVGGDLLQRPRCWYYRNGFGLLGQTDGRSMIPAGDNRYHAIFNNQGPAYFVNASSLAPALIALGASAEITGPGGSRTVNVAQLHRAPTGADEREHRLAANEVLTAIVIPAAGKANATYEVRQRQVMDWPLVAASVAFDNDGGRARNVSVVLGHVAPVPWASEAAARALEGQTLSAGSAQVAGQAATNGANPLSRNGYKVQLVRTAVKRAILRAAGIEEA